MTGWSGYEVMLNLFQHLYGELFLLQILKQVQDDKLLLVQDDKLVRGQDDKLCGFKMTGCYEFRMTG